MLPKCSRCHINPVTIKLTRIVKGKVIEMNLCQSCAAELSPYQKKFSPAQQSLNALIDMLKAEKSIAPEAETETAEAAPDAVCPACGVAYSAYQRSLMLGCAKCYDSFSEPLLADIRKVHGSVQHCGRVPPEQRRRVSLLKIAEAIKQELQEAIDDEDFERAALLRDRQKETQTELNGI